MAGIKKRLLRVAFQLTPVTTGNGQFSNPFAENSGNVIFTEDTALRVRIQKACLAIQNQASIEFVNMPSTLRQELLSQFSAWQHNQRIVNGVKQPYIDVYVAAGYEWTENGQTQNNLSQIYHGQITMVDQTGSPPNLTTRIVAHTNQVNKTQWVTVDPPFTMKFRESVFWAGNQMGFDNAHIVCQTSQDDQILINPFASHQSVASLLPKIQDWYHPDVAAFIDDDFLIVKDRTAILNPNDIAQLNDFVGSPNLTEWGVEGAVFVDPSIRLAGAAQFNSILNPFMNGKYVIMELDYWLASRETPFYVKVSASPAATD